MKKINVLGLTALFAAGGIGLAFNAPETNSSLNTFGQLEDGTWIELDPTKYECDLRPNTVCMAEFESETPPSPGSTDWVRIVEHRGYYAEK